MRYYSDELKKFYDTEEELLSAEEEHKQALEEKKETKAKLAKAIKDSEIALKDAYDAYDKAEEEVKKLQEEYDKKVADILDPVRLNIKTCIQNRTKCISDFNKKFGVYTTTYTGNDAVNEFLKLDNLFTRLFRF